MVFHAHAGFQLREDSSSSSSSDANGRFAAPEVGWFRLRASSAPLAPFASISSSMSRNLGSPGFSLNSIKETHTEMDFPHELCHKASPCSSLAGLGVRAKRILGIKNINVYALGIYVDDAAAKKALASRYKGASEDAISTDQALFDDVVSGSFEKSLRLVISFGSLKRATFLEALQERLEPRLKQAGEPSTMDKFKKQFDGINFARGTEIVFVQEGSKLVTKIDGQEAGAISSAPLCKSLFDIYLGADPVAPDAKTTFGKSLAAVLKN